MLLRMGNRLIRPQADGCCVTLDTSADTPPPAVSAEPEPDQLQVPEVTLTPARNSFEIMTQFNWDVVVLLRFSVITIAVGIITLSAHWTYCSPVTHAQTWAWLIQL